MWFWPFISGEHHFRSPTMMNSENSRPDWKYSETPSALLTCRQVKCCFQVVATDCTPLFPLFTWGNIVLMFTLLTGFLQFYTKVQILLHFIEKERLQNSLERSQHNPTFPQHSKCCSFSMRINQTSRYRTGSLLVKAFVLVVVFWSGFWLASMAISLGSSFNYAFAFCLDRNHI